MTDFIFKPFNKMTDEDYATVGFKSGLEIHQQLMTDKKLFCRCPAGRYNTNFDAEILRHMRPTLSELGEYDGTALMEFKTKKDIIYHINRDTVCTYEMDDTPPFEINEEALDIALEIGMLYRCSLIDEIHIARKQYLDGSIPTGFQRTSIVSVDGRIPYKEREISIIQLSIEEDSCRELSDYGHTRNYNTDRLGMPLIESVTGPDMKTPQEVAEVCKMLSNIVKSTGKVRTGAGAAREDVNVSVTGGTRIEIKGVPSIKRIPVLTYNEAMRQWNLLRLKDELKKRKITENTFKAKTENVSKILKKTKYLPLSNALNEGKTVYAVTLSGYKGLLNWQTQTDTYFSKEISDRVRVIACLTELPNIIHSDSTDETISSAEWLRIKKAIGTSEKDTVVIVWGNQADADTGAKEISIRAKEATTGVPSETRQALKDGTTGFERILPGPDRMYPDTDLPPKKITPEQIKRINEYFPEFYWEKVSRYKKLGVPEDIIESLASSIKSDIFKKATEEWNIDPVLASVVLIQYPKRLRKKVNTDDLNNDMLERILHAYKKGFIAREGILNVMEESIRRRKFNIDDLPPPIEDSMLENIIKDTIKEMKKKRLHNENRKEEVLKGMVMNKIRGRYDGFRALRRAMNLLKENK